MKRLLTGYPYRHIERKTTRNGQVSIIRSSDGWNPDIEIYRVIEPGGGHSFTFATIQKVAVETPCEYRHTDGTHIMAFECKGSSALDELFDDFK